MSGNPLELMQDPEMAARILNGDNPNTLLKVHLCPWCKNNGTKDCPNGGPKEGICRKGYTFNEAKTEADLMAHLSRK